VCVCDTRCAALGATGSQWEPNAIGHVVYSAAGTHTHTHTHSIVLMVISCAVLEITFITFS